MDDVKSLGDEVGHGLLACIDGLAKGPTVPHTYKTTPRPH